MSALMYMYFMKVMCLPKRYFSWTALLELQMAKCSSSMAKGVNEAWASFADDKYYKDAGQNYTKVFNPMRCH